MYLWRNGAIFFYLSEVLGGFGGCGEPCRAHAEFSEAWKELKLQAGLQCAEISTPPEPGLILGITLLSNHPPPGLTPVVKLPENLRTTAPLYGFASPIFLPIVCPPHQQFLVITVHMIDICISVNFPLCFWQSLYWAAQAPETSNDGHL